MLGDDGDVCCVDVDTGVFVCADAVGAVILSNMRGPAM